MLTGWWIHPYISVRQWTFLCVMLFISISNFFKENGWKSLRFKFEKQTKDLQAECLDIQCVRRYPNGPTQNSVNITSLELVPHQWSLLTKPLIITQLQSLPSKNQQSRRFSPTCWPCLQGLGQIKPSKHLTILFIWGRFPTHNPSLATLSYV